MHYISNEAFIFDPDFKNGNADFTDDNVFSPNEREQFLESYYTFIKNSYNLFDNSQYVVPFDEAVEETENLKQKYGADDGDIGLVSVYTRETDHKYKNWSVYTAKCNIKNDWIVMENAELPPNPAALFHIEKRGKIKRIIFDFYIDSAYKTHINGRVTDTTPGHSFVLRDGIKDVILIQFFANGECYAKYCEDDPYNLKHVLLGNFVFDEVQTITIQINESDYNVTLSSCETVNLPLKNVAFGDTLFFSGGMFHFGEWRIKPVLLETEFETINSFFELNTEEKITRKYIGEKELPFAIGGYEMRDQVLVFEKYINISNENMQLLIESLDPGGRVILNGETVAKTDSFENFKIDLPYQSENDKALLQIEVFPRAPEVLFAWHRHKDPYIGWFSSSVTIRQKSYIQKDTLQIRVNEANQNKVVATFSGTVDLSCKLNIYIVENCEKNNKQLIAHEFVNGGFCFDKTFTAKLWTPEKPNLYRVYFEAVDDNDNVIASEYVETGFRTIEQKNGELLLNGERIQMFGALQMQFLPPYENTPVTHICPSDEQIVWQNMMLKRLGGNTMRLHILGYGTNDKRFARFADQMGILLIWTTRYIDSVEGMEWHGGWRGKDGYLRQIEQVKSHPSIIIWEGANEFHPTLQQINDIYREFVSSVKSIDTTRLICPVSHLYYSADLYPLKDCEYYNDEGTCDQNGNLSKACSEWTDPLVVRSAHTYSLLLGYGGGWSKLRTQSWSEQENLFNNKERAYLVSEFAVIGRQDPNTYEAKNNYFNPYSYEFPDEKVLGFPMNIDKWKISQSYQALAATESIKQLRILDADSALWCCLMGGANDGGYLKPIIDNYGYAKLAFYTMKNCFKTPLAVCSDVDKKKGKNFFIRPVFFGEIGKKYSVKCQLVTENLEIISEHLFEPFVCDKPILRMPYWLPQLTFKSFVGIRFIIDENN